MSADQEEKSILDCSMSFSLLDENGGQTAKGECKAGINREYLTISPKFGDILPFHLRVIKRIQADDYKITLPLFSKETLVLSNLGYCFEDFNRVLSETRNEVILKDLLMNEATKKPDVNVEFVLSDANGNETQKGSGKVRLYETGLVVLPQNGEFTRVPYSDILNVVAEDYSIKVVTELEGSLIFRKMGSEFDPFVNSLSEEMNELQSKAVSSAISLFPGIDSVSLRKIAALLKEGKAAKRSDIEAINSRMWQEMEKKIASTWLDDSYSFLKNLGREGKTAVGFKRGLMGDITGEYLWFLIPIYGSIENGYGNAVAVESAETKAPGTDEASPDGDPEKLAQTESEHAAPPDEVAEAKIETSPGKATYFFRIVIRTDYPNFKVAEALDPETDKLIKTLNRCLLDINFRREPIYLSDEKLEEAQYLKYKIALEKIPSLQILRDLFIGRIIHSSPEQWKNDVMDLLKFNTTAKDNSDKWKKTS
jgi:hypothetical protein